MIDLLQSSNPIIRCKILVDVLGKDPQSGEILALQEEIRGCAVVKALLSERNEHGEIAHHPYQKWQGAHWVLTCLADLYYPTGDPSLVPLREQVYAWLFSNDHLDSIKERSANHRQLRLHASMEGNALFALLRLGLADERTDGLVERLLWAQWDDGGWNCDQHAKADTSSFMESITPLRGLALYAETTGDKSAGEAAIRAAEVFLERRLYRRKSDGTIIKDEFVQLFYPAYWHYNILHGLKVMAEAGFINDPRCQDALDLLESKRLPGGGFAAEIKKYSTASAAGKDSARQTWVNWGPTGTTQMNEYITADALSVLKAAGRA